MTVVTLIFIAKMWQLGVNPAKRQALLPIERKEERVLTVKMTGSDNVNVLVWSPPTDCAVAAMLDTNGTLTVYTCAASMKNSYYMSNGIRRIVIDGPENEACDFPVERRTNASKDH